MGAAADNCRALPGRANTCNCQLPRAARVGTVTERAARTPQLGPERRGHAGCRCLASWDLARAPSRVGPGGRTLVGWVPPSGQTQSPSAYDGCRRRPKAHRGCTMMRFSAALCALAAWLTPTMCSKFASLRTCEDCVAAGFGWSPAGESCAHWPAPQAAPAPAHAPRNLTARTSACSRS